MLRFKHKLLSALILAAPLLLNTGIATSVHASDAKIYPYSVNLHALQRHQIIVQILLIVQTLLIAKILKTVPRLLIV